MNESPAQTRRHNWLVAAVVVCGVLSNVATGGGGFFPVGECDGGPLTVDFQGDGQTGAATAPLGDRLVVRVQCKSNTLFVLIPASGEAVEWSVASGGGLINGSPTSRGTTSSFSGDGRITVLWQLGPAIGEQTVAAKVRDKTYTFRAAAGGATAGGTCVGGAGTNFGPDRKIVGDEIWPLAGSPYRGGRVFVEFAAKLTIAPGVVTCLQSLDVRDAARIVVDGRADAPVQMQPSAGSSSWWLQFDQSSTTVSGVNGLSTMRYVRSQNLTLFEIKGHPILLEDSSFTVDASASKSGLCPSFVWSLLPGVALPGESAARRVVFDGYGGPVSTCGVAGVSLSSDGTPAGGPMPFQARVLRSQGDALRIGGNAGGAFALSNCEVSGAARHGLVLDGTAAQSPASITGCNLTGNAGYALLNKQGAAAVADARGNWWGDVSGAPTAGGNAVSVGVNAASAASVPYELGY